MGRSGTVCPSLFITPPGLSVLIRELENQLGFRLFDRKTRHVVLTTYSRLPGGIYGNLMPPGRALDEPRRESVSRSLSGRPLWSRPIFCRRPSGSSVVNDLTCVIQLVDAPTFGIWKGMIRTLLSRIASTGGTLQRSSYLNSF